MDKYNKNVQADVSKYFSKYKQIILFSYIKILKVYQCEKNTFSHKQVHFDIYK